MIEVDDGPEVDGPVRPVLLRAVGAVADGRCRRWCVGAGAVVAGEAVHAVGAVVGLGRVEDVLVAERDLNRAGLLVGQVNAARRPEREAAVGRGGEVDVLVLGVLPVRLEEASCAQREPVRQHVVVAAQADAVDVLEAVQKGEITFCGEPLTEERLQNPEFAYPFRRRVGLVFQNPDIQLFSPTVFDEVAFGPLQLQWPKEKVRTAVEGMLEVMKIAHLRDRSPHHLSTGEKKRVTLASVLVLDPEVLLLDEPTAALDPRSASQMIDFLIGLRGGPKTVVTTTHDLDIVADIADECFVFQTGRVVASGTPAEILRQTSLLQQTNLIHSHRHVHATGETHSHPHLHAHEH